MVAVSLGTETDGSIICPASFNAIVGIKPTVGLTSRAGIIPFSQRQDTVGYVAPEYANSGLLNDKSDVYSFGVVLLEAITGRDPVDYGRPADEVNLVGWLKMMVGNRRLEEVADPTMETKPARTALKRALLTALRCVDPDSKKRVSMGEVVGMLESEEYQLAREECWL